MRLKDMAVEHSYYCAESNFYSREPETDWETATDFLDVFEDADIDMNLVFRWDVKPIVTYDDDDNEHYPGGFSADVFLMLQRKGIFAPHHIDRIEEHEVERFEAYLRKHWEQLKEIWRPLS